MTDFDTICTETWKIHLPSDWSERKRSAEHTAYFESADGTKGAYLSSWCFRDDPHSAREILESFRRVEVRTLHEMKDHAWDSVGEWSSDAPEMSTIGADFLDLQARFRIICHLIARLPWLVRSAFHDYDCADHDSSKRFFQPIIESLEIHNADG